MAYSRAYESHFIGHIDAHDTEQSTAQCQVYSTGDATSGGSSGLLVVCIVKVEEVELYAEQWHQS